MNPLLPLYRELSESSDRVDILARVLMEIGHPIDAKETKITFPARGRGIDAVQVSYFLAQSEWCRVFLLNHGQIVHFNTSLAAAQAKWMEIITTPPDQAKIARELLRGQTT